MVDANARYPSEMGPVLWDTLNVKYPIRQFPGTGRASTDIGHQWRGHMEVISAPRHEHVSNYEFDYNALSNINQSEATQSFGYKAPETRRYNKHTAVSENRYLNHPSRRMAERVPNPSAHGTTEMKESYKEPTISSRLVTSKDQYKHPYNVPEYEPLPLEPSFQKVIAPLDTTHEGFEKYLDPYLTTSRLHHRPHTAEQLSRPSVANDVLTYYTYADIPWVRRQKQGAGDWWLPIKRPKSIYDREKFKQDFREIRTHNKLDWVPGSFRTENRDNYEHPKTRPHSRIPKLEEDVRFFYERSQANLPTNYAYEHASIKAGYYTETRHIGSGRALCSSVQQHKEKNKRLEKNI